MAVVPRSACVSIWLGLALAALALGAERLGRGAMGVIVDPRSAAAVLAGAAFLLASYGLWRGWTSAALRRRAAGLLALGLAVYTLGLRTTEWVLVRAPEDVTFTNGELSFAGSLYLPRGGSSPYPAIIITHGAGRQTRDEGRYYARFFARHGIAALAFDKRGSGASSGDLATATYQDLAGDALAALRSVAGRKEIDRERVGLWGVSEGAWVVPVAAAEAPREVAFAIVVSSTAASPAEQVRYEVGQLVERAGHGREAAARAMELYGRTTAFERTGEGYEALAADLRAASREAWFEAARYLTAELPRHEKVLQLPWFPGWRSRMDFDGRAAWRGVECPVLVLLGGSDPKIDSVKAAVEIPAALQEGGNREVTVRVFPRAEHGLVEWWLPKRLPPPRFPEAYPSLMAEWLRSSASARLRRLAATQEPRGQEENGAQQRKDTFEGDADQAEGQGQQPDERPGEKRQDGEGPAEEEQEQPEQEVDHGGEPPECGPNRRPG